MKEDFFYSLRDSDHHLRSFSMNFESHFLPLSEVFEEVMSIQSKSFFHLDTRHLREL